MVERIVIGVRALVLVGLAVLITLLALPSPMRALPWSPLRAPNLEGAFEPNEALAHASREVPGQLVGPESVAIDAAGRIYSGTTDGKIVRVNAGAPVELFAQTGGRPLGMAFLPNGDLIVCDVMKGLLRVDREGNIEVLAHEAEGAPFGFLNDVTVSNDGHTVYLTDSSSHWSYGDHTNDILEADPTGRLIRYDLATRSATVLVRGLAFANGVALSADESSVLVSESARYRITRVMLTGDRRNIPETLVDNLPGFPDNLTLSPRGTYWVAMFSVRKSLLDLIHPFPFIKDCVAGLPVSLRPRPVPYGLVFEMDRDGRVLRSFHDPGGQRFREVSSVVEHDNALWFGTLSGTAIGRLAL